MNAYEIQERAGTQSSDRALGRHDQAVGLFSLPTLTIPQVKGVIAMIENSVKLPQNSTQMKLSSVAILWLCIHPKEMKSVCETGIWISISLQQYSQQPRRKQNTCELMIDFLKSGIWEQLFSRKMSGNLFFVIKQVDARNQKTHVIFTPIWI